MGNYRDRYSDDKPTMHKATCAECGKHCRVPFKPNGSRPIYCSDCFEDHSSSDRSYMRDDKIERKMYNATCDKCGQECKLPFKPSNNKPVYCSRCFENTSGRDGASNNNPAVLDEINRKLDSILWKLDQQNRSRPPVKNKPYKSKSKSKNRMKKKGFRG